MNFREQMAVRIAENAFSHGDCRLCERKGLSILLVRTALVPKAHTAYHRPKPELTDMKLGLRTLRAGYVYLLLDDKVWHAYQVTPDGYLRQFNPYKPPAANTRLLPWACVNADHHIPASFINIDTDKYQTVSMAFASDPWPRSVLDSYKALNNIERMQMFDLTTAQQNPGKLGDFLTAEQPLVHHKVYEYEAFVPGFDSVHAFHSRGRSRLALRNYLQNMAPGADGRQGVLMIDIDDPIGLVQEYNGLRASWAHARQAWLEEPERAYQQQTSQILLAIRAMHRQWAEHRVPSFEPMSGDGPPVFVSPEIERQRVVDSHTLDANQRLEQRYDEPRRAAFQQAHEATLQAYQQEIDRYGRLYAEAFLTRDFQVAMTHDYDGADEESGEAYSKTMALCLRGGISEAPDNPGGATAQLWQTLLQDPHSHAYQALLRRDSPLLAALLPSFSESTTWNDSLRLYDLLTRTIASDESRRLMQAPLQEAIAQLLGAVNGAQARLKDLVGPGVNFAISRINTASQLLYNRISLIELNVQMKLREYYALQSEVVRSLQHKFANGADRMVAGTRPKIRPMIQGGVLSLVVLDPKLADLMVKVSLWFEGTADDLMAAMNSDKDKPVSGDYSSVAAYSALSMVTVGLGTLDPQVVKGISHFKVPAWQASRWVRTSFAGLRGVAASAELLVAIGSMYLMGDALAKSLESAEEAVGDKSAEALIALQGSILGVLGGGVKLVGLALKSGATGVQKSGLIVGSGVKIALDAGLYLQRAGAVIIAISSGFDAIKAAVAAQRTWNVGDKDASHRYIGSTFFALVGAYYGVKAAASMSMVLGGPLGVAIGLSLLAYALFRAAESQESDLLETWAKRCFFGVANETPKIHWVNSEYASTALGELNAATLGMTVEITRRMKVVDSGMLHLGGLARTALPTSTRTWEYAIRLPFFDESHSAYAWNVVLHRGHDQVLGEYTSGETILREDFFALDLATAPSEWRQRLQPSSSKNVDYHEDSKTHISSIKVMNAKDNGSPNIKTIRGAIELLLSNSRPAVEAVTITLTYWPHRDSPDSYAAIISQSRWPD
ncbi:T6SS effector BTH_I2691 family protein [Pseudomonas sp. HR96]|uniref:T6SS effector BTH_I2691 family protein n=1 Tax=Pseudomonas sp. HR96 TaxID=1027966 RepID=UPI002A74EB6D|nr:T6SS effector BTH_I2691 family protein [Pseudomonas sp. HR96]WPO98560.1 T6SS effector BTH_I2691 family protein [Pseudomonas sp. HR96]